MAKSPKSPKSKGGKAAADGNRTIVWLSGLACGVMTAIAPGTALLIGGLLAPGLAALKWDKEPGRPVARTVLTCGLAGCVNPVMTFWTMGQSFDTAWSIVLDPGAIALAWGAAAGGWLMTQLAPLAVRATLEAGILARAARLRIERARIAEAWGLEEAETASSTPAGPEGTASPER